MALLVMAERGCGHLEACCRAVAWVVPMGRLVLRMIVSYPQSVVCARELSRRLYSSFIVVPASSFLMDGSWSNPGWQDLHVASFQVDDVCRNADPIRGGWLAFR